MQRQRPFRQILGGGAAPLLSEVGMQTGEGQDGSARSGEGLGGRTTPTYHCWNPPPTLHKYELDYLKRC